MDNTIDTIVQSLSKEEVRFFKLFPKRTESKNRKDVDLFDLSRRKNGDYTTKDALKTLKTNPNNYYQVKNRLYHELNNSMVWQHGNVFVHRMTVTGSYPYLRLLI